MPIPGFREKSAAETGTGSLIGVGQAAHKMHGHIPRLASLFFTVTRCLSYGLQGRILMDQESRVSYCSVLNTDFISDLTESICFTMSSTESVLFAAAFQCFDHTSFNTAASLATETPVRTLKS